MKERLKRVKESLSSAPNDYDRVVILRRIAANAAMSGAFAQGRRLLEEGSAFISDPKEQAELAKVQQIFDREERIQSERPPYSEKDAQRGRLKGQLAHIKDRLADARNQKKPEEDIRSIERVVQELERQVEAEK